jgi:hypothetical protein
MIPSRIQKIDQLVMNIIYLCDINKSRYKESGPAIVDSDKVIKNISRWLDF